ncbi:autotransporter outer membrane beta-barrel domain-containing protein [Pseudomonas sp. MBLB4123]|uniref:autotransporter family protein n=1 Tax=Pseudomonas sp. MBLB4123 TaxID=3451557 RepID=UPI003F754907
MHPSRARKSSLALAILCASLGAHAQTQDVTGLAPLHFHSDFSESLTLTGAASTATSDLIEFGGIEILGNVTNNATLDATGNFNSAIDVDGSRIHGTFINANSLRSQGNPATALNFGMSSVQGIVNNGTIHSVGAMDPDDDETVNALLLWNTRVGIEGLLNNGQITAEGDNSFAIKIENASSMEGMILNAGQIRSSGKSSHAISLESESPVAQLANAESGLISASGDLSRGLSISQGRLLPAPAFLTNYGIIQVDGRESIGVHIDHPQNMAILANLGTISATGEDSRAISLGSGYLDNPVSPYGLHLINTGTLQAEGIAIEAARSAASHDPLYAWLYVDIWEGLIAGEEAAIKGDGNVSLHFDGGEIRGDLLGLQRMFASGDALFNGRLIQSPSLGVKSLELGQPHTRLEGDLELGGDSTLDLNLHNQTDPNRAILEVSGDALFSYFGPNQIRLKPASEDFRGPPLREYLLISASRIEDQGSAYGTGLQVTSLSDLLQIESYEVTDTQVTAVVKSLSTEQVGDYLRQHGAQAHLLPAFNAFYGNTLGRLDNDDPLFEAMIGSNDQALVRLAQQLAPEVNGAAGQTIASNHNLLGNVLQGRSASLRRGLSSGDGLSQTGAWVQVLNSDADQGERRGVPGYDADSQGIAVGADGKLNTQTTLGLAYSYLTSDVRSQSGNKTDIEGHALTLYGGFEQGPWFADASLTYGRNDNESKRYIAGTRAKGDYDSQLWGLSLLGGYGIDLGQGLLLEPRVAGRYSNVQIDSFREKGSSAALATGEQRFEVGEIGAGVRLAGDFAAGQGRLEPEAKLMAYHDFIADQASSTSAFLVGGTPFVTNAAKPARDSYEAGLGLTYRRGAASLGLSYDYLTKADYAADTVQARLRYDF